MSAIKRRRFFIKGNFQLAFIAGFILLLSAEAVGASYAIYRLASAAFEDSLYRSHIAINRGAEIVAPIIIRVNASVILISIALACVVAGIAYFRLIALFGTVVEGLERLRKNDTSFRMKVRGGKNARELAREFNHAAAYIDKRRRAVQHTLDALIDEEELKKISQLHATLHSHLAGTGPALHDSQ